MQQGFGIILLADEVMRERRLAEAAEGRRARHAMAARDAARQGRRAARRPRRFALRVPRFVLSLTLVPTGRRSPAE
jgi:hypothetical protein